MIKPSGNKGWNVSVSAWYRARLSMEIFLRRTGNIFSYAAVLLCLSLGLKTKISIDSMAVAADLAQLEATTNALSSVNANSDLATGFELRNSNDRISAENEKLNARYTSEQISIQVDVLKGISENAGIKFDHATYKYEAKTVFPYRIIVDTTIHGKYPQFRELLHNATYNVPNLALEKVKLARKNTTDQNLSGALTWSLWHIPERMFSSTTDSKRSSVNSDGNKQ